MKPTLEKRLQEIESGPSRELLQRGNPAASGMEDVYEAISTDPGWDGYDAALLQLLKQRGEDEINTDKTS